MSLIAYIDESYNSEMFYIGAAVASQQAWQKITIRYHELRSFCMETYGISEDAELHAVEIMGGKKLWAPLRGKHREAAGILRKALAILDDEGVQYFFWGLDISRLHARFKYPQPPHQIALQGILRSLNDYASHQSESEYIKLVADIVDIKEELQAQFAGYQRLSSASGLSDTLKHLEYPIVFRDSKESAGLQAADIGAYLFHRIQRFPTERHSAAARARKPMERLLNHMTASSYIWLP